MDYAVHGILQARILQWVAFPFSRESSQARSLTLQADSFPAEPQGKPKNTGVGGLTLLQPIFLTQESDQGLLHCREILYQLSYQGIPSNITDIPINGSSLFSNCLLIIYGKKVLIRTEYDFP